MCDHRWRRVCEEFLLGGYAEVGWECIHCKQYVSNSKLTPAGLGGTVLGAAARLVGPHGGPGRTAGGRVYKEQIVDESGNLTVNYG